MNATELSQKICELLTARCVFTIYTKTTQFLVVGGVNTFDVNHCGLIATFDKANTQVTLEDNNTVLFECGNAYFCIDATAVTSIERF